MGSAHKKVAVLTTARKIKCPTTNFFIYLFLKSQPFGFSLTGMCGLFTKLECLECNTAALMSHLKETLFSSGLTVKQKVFRPTNAFSGRFCSGQPDSDPKTGLVTWTSLLEQRVCTAIIRICNFSVFFFLHNSASLNVCLGVSLTQTLENSNYSSPLFRPKLGDHLWKFSL